MVDALLSDARAQPPADGTVAGTTAFVLPHAGYVYSGSTAALGYAVLETLADRVRRVVLLGPTHRVPVAGLALPEADAFETPLGLVPVVEPDRAVRSAHPAIVDRADVHLLEHSLEVHVPFLQRVLPDGFELMPFAVGQAGPEVVAGVIDAVASDPGTVVIVSSDLSHYHAYAEARAIDGRTIRSVLALDPAIGHDQACGATPLNGLLTRAARTHARVALLGACSSGDTAGDRRRVVGYAAFRFSGAAAA